MQISEEKMERAIAAMKAVDGGLGSIQGFLYGKSHVVRDVSLNPSESEVWRMTTEDYDTGHAAMMAEIDRIRGHRIVEAVLKAVEYGQPLDA